MWSKAELLMNLIAQGYGAVEMTDDHLTLRKGGVEYTFLLGQSTSRFYVDEVIAESLKDALLTLPPFEQWPPSEVVTQSWNRWLQDTIDDQIAPRAAGGPVTPGVTYEISAGTDPEEFHPRLITSFDEVAMRRAVEEGIKKLAALYGPTEETPDDSPTE